MKPMFAVHHYVEIGQRQYPAGSVINEEDIESWSLSPDEIKTALIELTSKGKIEATAIEAIEVMAAVEAIDDIEHEIHASPEPAEAAPPAPPAPPEPEQPPARPPNPEDPG